ncbi:MAG: sigma 54-interacting transcriptional regulator [Pseudomonadota bacterium]
MLKILILGLTGESLSVLRRICGTTQLEVAGALHPPGKKPDKNLVSELKKLGVPLLKKATDLRQTKPDLIVDALGLPREDIRGILGEELFSQCSVMSGPAIATLAGMIAQYSNVKEVRVMMEAIIQSTQDAISVVDADGNTILVNRAYTRLTGLPEEDVLGKPAATDIAEGESIQMKVLHSRRPLSGMKIKVGPGKREVIVNAAPIIVDGQLRGSVAILHDVSEIRKLTEELSKAKRMIRQLHAKYIFDDIITESSLMKKAINQARDTAGTPATVLLIGESGTGKELFAHAIHNASQRPDGPFVRVNCSAIAESLMESELFGYEDGAFTGARKGGKKGFFEEADKGTVFLDEVGKMSLGAQAELLRVLQEKEVTRVGGTRAFNVDVRVIVATNADLETMVGKGTFREDLFYRLNVVPVSIPPLRRRKEDIPVLARHMIRKFNQEYGRSVKDITPRALELLSACDWPGNIRELENVISRAMINAGFDSDMIDELFVAHVAAAPVGAGPDSAGTAKTAGIAPRDISGRPLKDIMGEVEKDVILDVIEQCDGNKTQAARQLGIAIRNLYYKLEKFGIE